MQVVLKEMKKILTVKNIILILFFTILMFTFLLRTTENVINKYYGKYVYAQDFDLQLYQEVLSRVGPSISSDEAKVLDEIEEEQYKILDEEVRKYEELTSAGITTYKELEDTVINGTDDYEFAKEDEIDDLWHLCYQYYNVVGFYYIDAKTSEVSIETARARDWLYYIEYLKADLPFNWTEEELKDRLSREDAEVAEAFRKLYSRDEYSLLYPGAMYSLDELAYISMWITICCMFLILPYQVREKQSRTKDIKFTSKVGRNFYVKQWLAVVGSCLSVAFLNLFLYAICFCLAGYTDFLSCSSTTVYALYWIEMSFGMHIFVYVLLIMIFTAVVGTIFFILSEANSHVEALAMGIPCGILLVVVAGFLFPELFRRGLADKPDIMLFEVWVIGAIAFLIMYIFSIFVRKNLHMDVEE